GRAAGQRLRRLRIEPTAVLRQPPGAEHRQRALAAVPDEGNGRQVPAAGPQHIGRADVAGADLADIARAAEPGRDQPERGRPQKIAAGEDRRDEKPALHGLSLGRLPGARKCGADVRASPGMSTGVSTSMTGPTAIGSSNSRRSSAVRALMTWVACL